MAPAQEKAAPADSTPGKEVTEKNQEKMAESAKDPAAAAAAKKEIQPQRAEDLSPIHNTEEVGTSGGDQRSKPSDPDETENKRSEDI